jgi:hypothetical protein
MHPEAPTPSGSESWYNFTLTLNETVPLEDLTFIYFPLQNASIPNAAHPMPERRGASIAHPIRRPEGSAG